MATFIIDPSEQQEPQKITFNGSIEYCPACPPASSLMEIDQTDGYQHLVCPKCGYKRTL